MHLPLSARIVVFPRRLCRGNPLWRQGCFRLPPVDRVGRYLLDKGYTIFPVHPVRKTVWGLTAYPDLASLPQPVDIIDLFRAPQYCPAHAQEVLALPWKPLCFWMQEGIRSAEARALLEPEQILVVEDLCLMVEHARLLTLQK